ncbi:MAG: hypothetical protein AAGI54_02750 [Planctomycetota bacterium]
MPRPDEPTRPRRSPEEHALQQRIDASLRRLFADDRPPSLDAIGDAPPNRRPALARLRPALAIAALIALAAVVGAAWLILAPADPGPTIGMTPRAAYERFVDNNLTPDWRCETMAEFEQTFAERLGQPLTLAGFEVDGVAFVGISYAALRTGSAVAILAQADGQPVVVFVARKPIPDPTQLGPLHAHQQQIGTLHATELSPLDAPRVLPLLRPLDPTAEPDPESEQPN